MRKFLLGLLVFLSFILSTNSFAQEGTKQFMPNSSDRLWLEFNAFDVGTGFGMYNCAANKRINIRLKAGEKMFFGMKLSGGYGGNSIIDDPDYVYFRLRTPSGGIVAAFNDVNVPSSGTGYISTYARAIAGPNGAKLNGTTITGGYTPFSFTAAETGDYYIEFREDYDWASRFALEFFDVTVTDASNNIITNPGSPNISAGRLWSKAWQMTTTSFTSYKVNSYFYVFTSDEFINKINFQVYPYSFIFQSNSYGLTLQSDRNYIQKAQSKEDNQTGSASEYKIFLNDPDRGVWPNTRLVPPAVQVWAENNLFYDYSYTRTPQQASFPSNTVVLEKNMTTCPYSSVAIFKINSNIDGFTAILIDIDGDGSYSTAGSDRVIYRDMKKGNNYIVWDFKKDNGDIVPNGTFKASATFLGRGPTHFPMYDVEQLDGVQTSAVRPFKKLNNTIYWDDTYISRWGDETNQGLMDETQKKQLVIGNHVPRTWSWNTDPDMQEVRFNGNKNTLNTWFNAIDLGYSEVNLNVSQSATKCVDGLAPYVGDIYKDTLPNRTVIFKQIDFTKKFFDPTESALSRIRIKSLPTNGTLRLSGVAVTVDQIITYANIPNLTFVPNTNWVGRTSFDYEARNSSNKWSLNQDKVYITINTPPTISTIADQNLCTNTPSPAIPFTVSDNESPVANLTVTAFSADPNFVLNNAFTIGGSGTNRTIQFSPIANKSGSAIVYVMVDDGLSQTIQEFAVYTSPDLEFSGDTTLCVGQDLYLVAQETGASSYAWKYNGTTVSGGTSKILSKTWGTFTEGNWSLTITKGTCTSTRNFQVLISPLTTFTGDPNVCVGEEIALSAVENNASYEWKKGATVISTTKQYNKASAALTDNATNYTLKVTKDGCTATSPQFTISVVNKPTIGLTINGSTVNPGSNGTITVVGSQVGVTYNVYKNGAFVTSGAGNGSNLIISVAYTHLQIGNNIFEVRANNANCEIPMSTTATIVVREPGVTVSAISGNTSENGGTATFTVVLKTQPNASVTIPISSSDLTEGSVSASSLTFTTANWNSPQTVTVTGLNDLIIDGDITYSIEIGTTSSVDPYYSGINPNDLTLINTDNDIAAVIVDPISGLITEETGVAATFNVRLACQPSSDVTFTLSSSNPLEGTVSPTTLTFTSSNWMTNRPVTVTGVDDLVDDGDVTYSIVTSSTSSADLLFNNLTVSDVSVTNRNNDFANVIVNPTSGLVSYETGPSTSFTIRLSTKPTQNVSITLSSSNVGEGNVSPTSVVFTPTTWDVAQTITINGVNDDIDDGNISYTVQTSNASSTDSKYNNMTVADVSVVNMNDDVAGVTINPAVGLTTTETGGSASFGVKLNSKPTANVSITLTSSNSQEGMVSPVSLTFTPDNWNVLQSALITGVNEFIDDGDVVYSIITSASSGDSKYNNISVVDVSVTNQDDDVAGIFVDPIAGLTTNESGTSVSFTIVLTSQPTSNVTIDLASNNTGEGIISKSNVVFSTSNWAIPQSVTVTGVNDAIADGPQAYSIITSAAVSGDPKYNGFNPSDVSVVNNDNDEAGITVSPKNLTTLESGTSVSFTVVLNTQPTSDVTIYISSNNPNEGTVSESSITFTSANWSVARTINVTPVNDSFDDDDVTYSIVLSNASSADSKYNNKEVDDVSVVNRDDDTAGFIFDKTSGIETSETGTTATFNVRLSSKPTSNVTFTLTSSNPLEGTVSDASLTFTPDNWSTNRVVTITGVDDLVDDDDVSYAIITGLASSSDSKYSGLVVPDVSVVNRDNDNAGFTLENITGLTTSEAGLSASFTVRLNTKPTSNVTIAISSNNINEGTVSTSSLIFTSTSWNTPLAVTITGVNDDVDDDDVTYAVVTGNASSLDSKYNGKDVPDVNVVNIDNDNAGITLSRTSGLVTSENGDFDTFTIKLNTQPKSDVTIGLSSSNSSEGVIDKPSVTFNSSNWYEPQTIKVTGVNDDIDDDNIAYSIVTSAAVSSDIKYNGINPSDVSAVNTDNDEAGFIFTSNTGLTTGEDGSTATFYIRLMTRPTANVTIGLSSSNPLEGTVTPMSLLFTTSNWNTDLPIKITGFDDDIDDGNISYTIVLAAASSSDTKYNTLNPADVSVINIDNDVAGIVVDPIAGLFTTENGGQTSFKISLSSQPLADVIITIMTSNSAEGVPNKTSKTFNSTNWKTPETITVTGQNDDIDDDDVAYSIVKQSVVSLDPLYSNIDFQPVAITNRDDDNAGYNFSTLNVSYAENDAPVVVNVSLRSKPLSNVKFDVVSENPAKGIVSPASLEFTPANWSTNQPITITPVNNYVVDGTANFNIITSLNSVTEPKYSSLNPPDIEVTVSDNDVAGITVSAISGNTREDGTTATFTVVLNSEPISDVTIGVSSSNTAEGTVSTPSLTFTPIDWSTPKTVTVTGVDDVIADGNVTYNITLDAAVSTDPVYNGINPADVSIVNIDLDKAGFNIFPTAGLSTTEAGGSTKFSINLNTIPSSDVKVNIVSNDNSEGTVSTSSVTFTAANYSTPQEVTVIGVDDLDDDGDILFSILCTVDGACTEPNYKVLTIDPVPVTNIDDIKPRPVDDNTSTDEKTSKNINVLANDLGLDNGSISVSIVNQPTNGKVVVESNNTVTYIPNGLYNGVETFVYKVTDASGAFANATVTVNVTFVNDTPVAVNDSRGTSINNPVVVDVLFNDYGLEDGGIVVSISENADPTKGTAVANVDNTVTFTPKTGYLGLATFKYKIADANADESIATVTINVRKVNHVPVAVDDNATTTVNRSKSINILANDSGLEDGFRQISAHTEPANGVVIINANRTVTYTPNPGFIGSDSFQYLLEDADEDYDIATVNITVTPAIDHQPIARDDFRGASKNTAVKIDVLFNDTGLEDGFAGITIISDPVNGTYSINADTVVYTPNTDFYGVETFSYQVCDTDGDCAAANITVNVKNGINYIPKALNDKDSTIVNTPISINVMKNDTGLEDGFNRIEIHEQPEFGSVTINSDRTVTYTPTYMFVGTETFKYFIEDADGDYSLATVTVLVKERPNYIPEANNDSRGCSFNTPVVVDVLFNDKYLDDAPVVVTVKTNPTKGTALANTADNTITFAPESGFIGIMTFEYTVTDDNGDSDDALVTINVKPGVNIVPTAVNDNATTLINKPVDINVLANDRGLEDGFKKIDIHRNPTNGIAIINANRTITYTPSYMFIGIETFQYYIEDADGDLSVATVVVSVIERPDYKPIANDDSRGCSFNTPVVVDVLLNDSGLDDSPVTVAIISNPLEGSATVNPADNKVTFTPKNNFVGLMTFEYSVTDVDADADTALVTINVKAGVNNVPTAVNDNASTLVNTPVDINVLANDSGLDDGFGDLIVYSAPSFGTVILNLNRTVTYTPSYMFVGTETFQYAISDMDGDISVATVTVTISDRPNYIPVANDDRRGCSFNTPVIVDVLFNDKYLDDAPVVVTVKTNPTQGTAIVNSADNSVTFTPATDFIGLMTFDYTVTDANGDADDAKVTINVKAGINIVPKAENDNATTIINKPVDINVLANDKGLDDGFDKIEIHKQPAFGSVTVNANRTVTYTPSYMFIGTETFQYYIEDLDGDYSLATVTVTVTDRPDYKPVANDDRRGCSRNTAVIVDVLSNDTGLDDAPVVVSVSQIPVTGNANVNTDGTVTYTPATDFVGEVSFRYTVIDADGDTDDALVTIRVKDGLNIVPKANDDNATTFINKSVGIAVLVNDTGLEDGFDKLSIHKQPLFGTVVINTNRTITYIPSYMFLGTETFQYKVEDVDGDYSVATVTVTVTERPDYVPLANDDYRGATYNEPRIVDVLINDTGLDDAPVVVAKTSDPAYGSVNVNADNTITYTPNGSYIGQVQFDYTVTDADGDSDAATVFINVKVKNMIPVALDDIASTLVNTPVNVHVLDNDSLLYEGIKGIHIHVAPKWGSAVVNSDNTITYTPSSWYVGNDEFVYYVEDVDGDYDIATVRVTVLDYQNSIPIANDDRRGTSKNTPVDVDVLINDDGLDDGWIRVFIKDNPNPSTGSVVVSADNTVTFTPATDYIGDAIFKYFITDRNNDTSNVATATISVKEINYVPEAVLDTISTVMNLPILIDVVNNDTGLEDGLDYIKLMSKPTHGFAYVFDDRNIKYFPASWFIGTDSLTYMVVDTDGDYDIAKVIITIKDRVDHKPKANPDGRGTSKNQSVIVDVLFNDTGMEDGGLTMILNNLPSHGSVLLNSDNTITYTPSTDYLGEDVFYYQVCDFDSDCSSAAVTINVKTLNLVPIAVNDTVTTYKNRSVSAPVLFNDKNLNDGGTSVKVHVKPLNGSAVVNPDKSINYTPKTDFYGIDSLWYFVSDIDGDYALAKMVIEVLNRENNIPEAIDDEAVTFINTFVLIEVLENDKYLIDGIKSVSIINSALNGDCSVDSYNRIVYTPFNEYKGSDSFTYRVCDIDNDCDEASVTISITPDASKTIEIPEAFSPNDDRINDTFEILNLVNYGRVTLKVYNRWGNLVYKSDKYKNDWDGTSNASMAIGSKLPDGTYYYIIEIVETGKIYKGSVFIKR